MSTEKKDAMIASIENLEAIEEFLKEWWSVADLHETISKVSCTIINLTKRHQILDAELEDIDELMQQHMMIIGLLKNFERKEGEV